MVLGWNQVWWDNESGQEPMPPAFTRFWDVLTDKQKKAAMILGYTQRSWDNESRLEPQPRSASKSWAELTVCPGGEGASILAAFRFPFAFPCWELGVAIFVDKSASLNANFCVFVVTGEN